MPYKSPQEIIREFGSLKKKYITPTPNKPFDSLDFREIEDMLGQVDDWSRSGMDEVKEALGYSSYQKALNGDYSEFERVHPVLRNYHAMKYEQMARNTLADIEAWRTDPVFGPDLADMRLRQMMYNPALRLGMSIMQNDGTGQYSFYQTLDNKMIDDTESGKPCSRNDQKHRTIPADGGCECGKAGSGCKGDAHGTYGQYTVDAGWSVR